MESPGAIATEDYSRACTLMGSMHQQVPEGNRVYAVGLWCSNKHDMHGMTHFQHKLCLNNTEVR